MSRPLTPLTAPLLRDSVQLGRVALLVLVALVVACAPASAPADRGPAGGAARVPTPTLVTVVRVEPVSLAARPVQASGAGVRFVTRVFNAQLDEVDNQDRPFAYLAEALPQLNTDTWRVLPDGRMETSYRLRPNLAWHDGTRLSADDFAFALRVYKTPELGVGASPPIKQMEEVLAPDDRTVIIRWGTLYPDAGGLRNRFQPLPRHILEGPFATDPTDLFANHPYWSVEYVGLGPFKLERWEPGAFVEGTAFDGHVLGRPKIDRIVVRFIADENTALANLLSENVHLATDRSIRFEHVQVMQKEWSTNNRGVVILSLSLVRYILAQFRPEVVEPRGMLDVRVRRALFHAVDKQALNDGVFDGQAVLADTFVNPDVPYYAEVDRAINKYPYDVRRSEQLMADTGFPKARSGFFEDGAGRPFRFLFWEESGSQNEKELNVLVDTWRRAGFDVQTFVLPAVQLRDAQLRATFPALYTTQGGGSTDDRLDTFSTSTIPTPANRFSGNNRGGWANADYDRLWEGFTVTLDRGERDRQVVGMLKMLSEEVPSIPIYFNFAPTAHLAMLRGPQLGARIPDAHLGWNIHEWEWR